MSTELMTEYFTDAGLHKVSEDFGLTPILKIKQHLDRIFGTNVWAEYEPETISLELGFLFDKLLADKIEVLRCMVKDYSLFHTDPIFFLYATEVINDKSADFEELPTPTAMEIAYAVKVFPGEFSYEVKKVITYLLAEEGYTEVPEELNGLVFESELPEPFQSEEDMDNKLLAVTKYLDYRKRQYLDSRD